MSGIFDAITINGVRFENRILRSSVGGRTCNYDGTVTDVWKNFERRFAAGGIGGIISTTFHTNRERLSPLQYPSIADDKYLPHLAHYIAAIKATRGCKYIVQIGDPGYTTYTSLFPEELDGVSSSDGFDFAFGYRNRRSMMSDAMVKQSIAEYAAAAGRVRSAGADGVEITATKGYLIHQFLNPGINRRTDDWGGDPDRRFRLLEAIVKATRATVGRDYLLGIRLSGEDFNASPWPLSLGRWPSPFLSGERRHGNRLPQMLDYAQRLKALGVDYLHVVSGYGFPNPRDVPGPFPFDEIRMFFDSVRHLGAKAAARAALLHLGPSAFWRWFLNIGWRHGPEVNLSYACEFKRVTGLPVIANGGFQDRGPIEKALVHCDMVSMARALIANPGLLDEFRAGRDKPGKPCTRCNRCVGRTTTSPLGCYDVSRFNPPDPRREMIDQILEWNRSDPPRPGDATR